MGSESSHRPFFFFTPATLFSPKRLPQKVTPMGTQSPSLHPRTTYIQIPLRRRQAGAAPGRSFVSQVAREGGSWDAGNSAGLAAAGKKPSSDLRDHATRQAGSPNGDTGITKLGNRPPRLLPPPSPGSRAAAPQPRPPATGSPAPSLLYAPWLSASYWEPGELSRRWLMWGLVVFFFSSPI